MEKLKKLYINLVHKDLYYFKTKKDAKHWGTHNLSALFLKEEKELEINGQKFYSFSIVYPSKTRYYLVDNENYYKI